MPKAKVMSSAQEVGVGVALDPTVLDALREDLGGDESLVDVVSIYLGELEHRMDSLAGAVIRKDCAAVHLGAHTLATTSALLGAATLADLCRQLEAKAEAGIEMPVSSVRVVEAAAAAVHSALHHC